MLKFNPFQVFVTIFTTPIGINESVKSIAMMFCPIFLQNDVHFQCNRQFLYRFNFLSETFCLQSPPNSCRFSHCAGTAPRIVPL